MPDDQSKLIRQAFADTISVLGEQGARALIEDLERQGIDINNLTLEKLAVGLRNMLGNETADIIMQEIILRLDKWHSSQ